LRKNSIRRNQGGKKQEKKTLKAERKEETKEEVKRRIKMATQTNLPASKYYLPKAGASLNVSPVKRRGAKAVLSVRRDVVSHRDEFWQGP